MNSGRNGPWYSCLPGCTTRVPCGRGLHTVRWEAGVLGLPEHPDAEGELVLAALGGEKAGCVELAEAWQRHANDLSVLAIGPRGPADEIAVSWDDVASAKAVPSGVPLGGARTKGPTGPPSTRLGRLASQPLSLHRQVAARHRQAQEEMERSRRRASDMLSLLALGYGFQVRLVGQVAAAYADRLDEQAQWGATAGRGVSVRPAMVAATTGRLAPVAEKWLGIDPDQVVVSLHSGPGWGSAELTGRGEERRLRVAVPAWWLPAVWACGLALVGRHLVVAVERPGWPHARVLGLRSPGAQPEPLDVHTDPDAPPDDPHWEV